jgi:hypothetical protein
MITAPKLEPEQLRKQNPYSIGQTLLPYDFILTKNPLGLRPGPNNQLIPKAIYS